MKLLFEPLIDKSIHTSSFLKKYQYDQSNSPSDIDYVTDIAKKGFTKLDKTDILFAKVIKA